MENTIASASSPSACPSPWQSMILKVTCFINTMKQFCSGFFHLSLSWLTVVCRLLRWNASSTLSEYDDSHTGTSALKREFLYKYGKSYGYSGQIDRIREKEFKRLNGTIYLDHAGATLYSSSQMQAIMEDLNSNLYGNPHSQNDRSVTSSNIIASAREEVLRFLNASPKDYKCIFTSGATAALKLIGENFPWSHDSCYLYTMENHNSVLGIRQYALNKGATAAAVDVESMGKSSDNTVAEISSSDVHLNIRGLQKRVTTIAAKELEDGEVYHLFSFPSECNFSGAKFDPDLVKLIQAGKIMNGRGALPYSRGKWMVLLDAAKGCGTQPPDLSKFPADFVVMSFYKIFGYPTGLGALIVRTDAAEKLQKSFFSGGTVAASIADIDFIKPRENICERFEDGTISFLSIASLKYGFNALNQLGISNIARHTGSLAAFTSSKLNSLEHSNNVKACLVYGSCNDQDYLGPLYKQGPVVTFNLKRPDGSIVGHREVEKLAALRGIQLRTGCFCNPGACSKHLELSHRNLKDNFESGHECWDDVDIISGKPTGAVRVSFGYMSTIEDAEVLINFIDEFFISKLSSRRLPLNPKPDLLFSTTHERRHYLEAITIYPIKSCGGFNVDRWPLCETGLLHDREWLLTNAFGEVLTQKKVPSMCSIQTFIDCHNERLLVTSPHMETPLEIPLEINSCNTCKEKVQVCRNRTEATVYGIEVNEWFSKALQQQCALVRKESGRDLSCRRVRSTDRSKERLSFVNEGQLLLISKASVQDLKDRIISKLQTKSINLDINPQRFRPNLVISGSFPYEEDKWQAVTIGEQRFDVMGGCNRCEMINIDPKTGVRGKSEPLSTLASYRRDKGKIIFGILLTKQEKKHAQITVEGRANDMTSNCKSDCFLTVGSSVTVEARE